MSTKPTSSRAGNYVVRLPQPLLCPACKLVRDAAGVGITIDTTGGATIVCNNCHVHIITTRSRRAGLETGALRRGQSECLFR